MIKTVFENSREYATTYKVVLEANGLINLNQSSISLKKNSKKSEDFISYVQLMLANVKSLNNSFLGLKIQ